MNVLSFGLLPICNFLFSLASLLFLLLVSSFLSITLLFFGLHCDSIPHISLSSYILLFQSATSKSTTNFPQMSAPCTRFATQIIFHRDTSLLNDRYTPYIRYPRGYGAERPVDFSRTKVLSTCHSFFGRIQ